MDEETKVEVEEGVEVAEVGSCGCGGEEKTKCEEGKCEEGCECKTE